MIAKAIHHGDDASFNRLDDRTVPVLNRSAENHFLLRVAVPPQGPGRQRQILAELDQLAGGAVDPSLLVVPLAREDLHARMLGENIRGHALAVKMERGLLMRPELAP